MGDVSNYRLPDCWILCAATPVTWLYILSTGEEFYTLLAMSIGVDVCTVIMYVVHLNRRDAFNNDKLLIMIIIAQ